MSGSGQDSAAPQDVLQLQIVVGAMIGGCLFFLAIALVLRVQGAFGAAAKQPIVTYVAVGFAVLALAARVIVPAAVVRSGRGRLAARQAGSSDPAETTRELWRLLTTRTIVAAALLEGATFFSLVAYMLEGSPLALVIAVLLIVGLGMHMPTRSTAAGWIERQTAALKQEQQWGR